MLARKSLRYFSRLIIGREINLFLGMYFNLARPFHRASPLDQSASGPTPATLQRTLAVVQTIRQIGQTCAGLARSFDDLYLLSLFLYSLAVLKYPHRDKAARLAFGTATIVGQYLTKA